MDDFEFKIHIIDKDYRAYVETIKEKFKNPQVAREWCNNKDGGGYFYVVDKESIEKFNALKEKDYFTGELQKANQYADDMYDKYLNAKMRAKKLEFGPGGIMDMKQTIADKEAMIYALESQIGLMKNYAESEKN